MTRARLNPAVIAVALAAVAPLVQAEIIFNETFDSPASWSGWTSAADSDNGPNNLIGTGARKFTRTQIGNPTVKETIRVDAETTSRSDPLSVTSRTWDIHDGSTNVNASGYRAQSTAMNTNMSGNILGHAGSGSSLPSGNQDNYFQIDGIKIDSDMGSLKLAFEFDSGFHNALDDGFGVAFSIDGINFDILNPAAGSAMQYSAVNTSDQSLDYLLGESTLGGVTGFTGAGGTAGNQYSVNVAGTALFDLASSLAGKTISLRFAFASDNQHLGSGYGINIDNIRVTGNCVNGGSGAGCDTPPPNTGVPEPASLALALLGLTAVTRRQLRRR